MTLPGVLQVAPDIKEIVSSEFDGLFNPLVPKAIFFDGFL
jgi:hypothetical protein